MERVLSDLWQRSLEKIRQRIGSERFDLWFKNTELAGIEDGVAKVGAPNLFVAEWLQAHFSSLVAEALVEECGESHTVEFLVSPGLNQAANKQRLVGEAEIVAEGSAKAAGVEGVSRPRIDFRLDNYVVGSGSYLAHACALEVANNAHARFNPLFIHSECGLGKTHLLHGVWNHVQESQDGRTVEYVSGEVFTNEFVYAMRSNRLDGFRSRYRNVDVLLIDDVNFFNGKERLQEELLHTFNALHSSARQIVLASDTHPRKMSHFRRNLVSRFVSGMVASIEAPDYGTRLRILKTKVNRLKAPISPVTLEYIASECHGSVRDLEGALNSVIAFARLSKKPADVEMAREILKRSAHSVAGGNGRAVNMESIENAVIAHFRISKKTLHSNRKSRRVTLPKQVCIYLAREMTRLSCGDIALHFGYKHHTSVLFAAKRIKERMENEPHFESAVKDIERKLRW